MDRTDKAVRADKTDGAVEAALMSQLYRPDRHDRLTALRHPTFLNTVPCNAARILAAW